MASNYLKWTMRYLRCKCFRSFHIIYFRRFMSWSFIFKRNRIFWTPIKYTIFFKIVTSQASSEYVFQIIVVWCLREFQTSAVSEILNIDNLDSQWVANFYSKLIHNTFLKWAWAIYQPGICFKLSRMTIAKRCKFCIFLYLSNQLISFLYIGAFDPLPG